MAFLPPTLTTIIGGFLFFRLFDIIKPPPARAIHRQTEGGLAVVLDDAVAGIYTNILIQLAVLWHPEIIFTLDRFLLRTG